MSVRSSLHWLRLDFLPRAAERPPVPLMMEMEMEMEVVVVVVVVEAAGPPV